MLARWAGSLRLLIVVLPMTIGAVLPLPGNMTRCDGAVALSEYNLALQSSQTVSFRVDVNITTMSALFHSFVKTPSSATCSFGQCVSTVEPGYAIRVGYGCKPRLGSALFQTAVSAAANARPINFVAARSGSYIIVLERLDKGVSNFAIGTGTVEGTGSSCTPPRVISALEALDFPDCGDVEEVEAQTAAGDVIVIVAASIGSVAASALVIALVIVGVRRRQRRTRRGLYAMRSMTRRFRDAAGDAENDRWDEFEKTRDAEIADMLSPTQRPISRRGLSRMPHGSQSPPAGSATVSPRLDHDSSPSGNTKDVYAWYQQGARTSAGQQQGLSDVSQRVAYLRRQGSKIKRDVGRHGDRDRLGRGVRETRGPSSPITTSSRARLPEQDSQARIIRPERRLGSLRDSVQRMPSVRTLQRHHQGLRATGTANRSTERSPLTGGNQQ